MPTTIRYRFTQQFAVCAKEAFDWCTNFDPGDHALMGEKAERQVTKIAEGSVLLKDTFHTSKGTVQKQKLIELYPDQQRWTSSHLSGPNIYSQFLYHITPNGEKGSILEFIGLHLEHDENLDANALAERLCKEDANVWVLLAASMERELKAMVVTKN